jgi:hypothetical protein
LTDESTLSVLISTVKACLVSDLLLRATFNVTVSSATTLGRKLSTSGGLRGKKTVLSTASVVYLVSFDVDKQQYLTATDGYSQMTTSFSTSVQGDKFTSTLQANAVSGSNTALASASGAVSATYSQFTTRTVQLLYPSFAPTVSCRPTVIPTQQPSTRTPTRAPTTIAPTRLPTTAMPTALPTFRTGESFIVPCVPQLKFIPIYSKSNPLDCASRAECRGDFHRHKLTDDDRDF